MTGPFGVQPPKKKLQIRVWTFPMASVCWGDVLECQLVLAYLLLWDGWTWFLALLELGILKRETMFIREGKIWKIIGVRGNQRRWRWWWYVLHAEDFLLYCVSILSTSSSMLGPWCKWRPSCQPWCVVGQVAEGVGQASLEDQWKWGQILLDCSFLWSWIGRL